MEFWKNNFSESSLAMAQELCYTISRNFCFWNVSIRALYQKLWSFEVFLSKNFWNPKSMIQTSRKYSKHTKIRKHTSYRQWEQNQWMQIDPNEIYQNQRMQKWSEWNHKRQWEQRKMGENNTRGRTPHTNENMSKKAR